MRFKLVLALAAAVALSGCVVIAVDGDKDGKVDFSGNPKTCIAADHQHLIGKNERDIDRARLPQSFRIICHGCQATMDFRQDRLSIQLDADNKVVSASCE
jgi:hypothetical protein